MRGIQHPQYNATLQITNYLGYSQGRGIAELCRSAIEKRETKSPTLAPIFTLLFMKVYLALAVSLF